MAIRVLHVDPDEAFLDVAAELLEAEDERLDVVTARTVDTGLEILSDRSIDCLVSEYEFTETDGIEFFHEVHSTNPNLPFVLFTGTGSEAVASEAVSAGVTDYLRKTGDSEQFTLLANRIIQAVEASVARERVKRREREYRTLLDASPVPIVVVDTEHEFLYANTGTASLLAVESVDALLGESVLPYLHPEDKERGQKRLEHVLTEREPVEPREFRVVNGSGETRYVHGNILPVTFDGAEAAQVVLVDITERKERAQDLERYRRAVEVSGDAIYALDDEGYFQMVNERHGEFFGHEGEDVVGKHASKTTNEQAIEKGETVIRELLRDDQKEFKAYEFEQERDGELRVYENTVSLMMEDGKFQGSVGIIRDITERKRAEEELKRQNERLDKFASVVSHDLKNPLNVAELRLNLVKDECESEHLDDIEQAHSRMRTLIDSVLELAREGESVDNPGLVDIETVANTCWQTTETRGGELVVDSTNTIRANESRLRALFENLFRNSMEHGRPSPTVEDDDSEPAAPDSETATITITVGVLPDETGFYVEDDGKGFAESMQEDLFEYGTSSDPSGTGFGLAIVKEIVDAHDWEITATESTDGGARFEITGVEFIA